MNKTATTASLEAPKIAGAIYAIPTSRIEPDTNQPRKKFTEEEIQALADSIKAEGLLQPITVRPNPDKPGFYLINTGERRWRAHRLAGLPSVRSHVAKEKPDTARVFRTQVIENKGRQDMTPKEDAFAALQLQTNGDSDAVAATTMCMSVSRLRQVRAMTKLSDVIWQHIEVGSISAPVAEYACGNLPEKMYEEVLLRCVGKTKNQAAAIVDAVVDDLKQESFNLECEKAGVKEKRSEATRQFAAHILQAAELISKLSPKAQRQLARTMGAEISKVVPNTKQSKRAAVFITNVMTAVTARVG